MVIVMGPMPLLVGCARALARFWGYMTYLLLGDRHYSNVSDRQPNWQVLYAAKHQSAWEIILCWLLAAPPAEKRELLCCPLLAGFLKTGCIPVDRSAGMSVARNARRWPGFGKRNGPCLYFRKEQGCPRCKKRPYEIGVFRSMKQLASWCRLR